VPLSVPTCVTVPTDALSVTVSPDESENDPEFEAVDPSATVTEEKSLVTVGELLAVSTVIWIEADWNADHWTLPMFWLGCSAR
jgi:hypothetical protein